MVPPSVFEKAAMSWAKSVAFFGKLALNSMVSPSPAIISRSISSLVTAVHISIQPRTGHSGMGRVFPFSLVPASLRFLRAFVLLGANLMLSCRKFKREINLRRIGCEGFQIDLAFCRAIISAWGPQKPLGVRFVFLWLWRSAYQPLRVPQSLTAPSLRLNPKS